MLEHCATELIISNKLNKAGYSNSIQILEGATLMKTIGAIAVISTLLTTVSGCATQVTSASGRTVVVRAGFPDMGVEKALNLAEAECNKQGLSARVQSVTSPTTDRYIFECVKLGN